ncbi:branched-chain amino acid ABC transporter substrate-binding protein [Rhodoferax koreense]|uniref:Branched-chain amino acid ABC transporter substrate-binding protein n=1 Tax=Rhodoferax koreensis TaxID=1842727 RepID=A0A1P8K2E1_9BURK|nr:ABC transporter substrate-binding protein [Rhodoferax koreense]APW40165.1 branched-chain amino acid ABC transporter substrate-binding protein [Rhodoferax koreense]
MKVNLLSTSLAAAITLACTGLGHAQSVPTLYVGSYGGSSEKLFKEKIIPAFEAAHKVKIVYVAGNSTDTLAKLQAQKDKQELDLVIMDDGPMQQAVQFGFCEKIKDAPVYKDLYPLARISDRSVAIGAVATGLAYNTEAFKKAGLPKPDSWEILTDKKFKQKLAIPPISNTYGLQTLIMYAKMRGGGETSIDSGFTAMTKEVAPNVLAWEPSPGKMTELFQNGDINLAVWGSGRVESFKATGFPIEFVYPKEGAMALMIAACPVVQSDVPEPAQALLQYLLTPEVQAWLADTQGFGPVNSNTKLEPAVAAKVPYGPAQIGKLLPTNWTVVNEKRGEWTNRWNRTIER